MTLLCRGIFFTKPSLMTVTGGVRVDVAVACTEKNISSTYVRVMFFHQTRRKLVCFFMRCRDAAEETWNEKHQLAVLQWSFFDSWCSLHTRLQKLPMSYKHGSLTWILDLNRTNDLSQLRMLRLGWKPVASSFFCKGGPFRAEPDCRFSYNPPGFTLPAYASQRLGHKQKSTEKNMSFFLKSKTFSEVLG